MTKTYQSRPTKRDAAEVLKRRLIVAHIASLAASQRRASLPDGSSRAAITRANAVWARCAEERDRLIAEFEACGGNSREALQIAEYRQTDLLLQSTKRKGK
jgi:hypothetical protein